LQPANYDEFNGLRYPEDFPLSDYADEIMHAWRSLTEAEHAEEIARIRKWAFTFPEETKPPRHANPFSRRRVDWPKWRRVREQ
jgi:hypothetical protein